MSELLLQLKQRAMTGTIRSKRIQAAPGQLSLTEWLEVSWFYPEGFICEGISRGRKTITAEGSAFSYRFYRSEGELATFARRWRAACREVLSSRPFAPDLHLGLRLLRFEDGEPTWLPDIVTSPDANVVPDADEVAVVIHHVPTEALLINVLDEVTLEDSVRALAGLHRRARRVGRERFLRQPEQILSNIRRKSLNRLNSVYEHYGSYLDPFSQLALLDIKAFLERSILRVVERLYARGEQGLLVPIHGNLQAQYILTKALRAGGRVVSLLEREAVFGDVCQDIAGLIVDLQLQGEEQLAASVAPLYESAFPRSVDRECLRFFTVLTALRRAEESFERNFLQAEKALAVGLRAALGFDGPYLIALGGGDQALRNNVASAVCELGGGILLPDNQALTVPSIGELPWHLRYSELLRRVDRLLTAGSSVVLSLDLHSLEERMQLAELARKGGFPVILVRVCAPPSTSDNTNSKPWAFDPWSPSLPELTVEASLPASELAQQILTALATRQRRGEQVGNYDHGATGPSCLSVRI